MNCMNCMNCMNRLPFSFGFAATFIIGVLGTALPAFTQSFNTLIRPEQVDPNARIRPLAEYYYYDVPTLEDYEIDQNGHWNNIIIGGIVGPTGNKFSDIREVRVPITIDDDVNPVLMGVAEVTGNRTQGTFRLVLPLERDGITRTLDVTHSFANGIHSIAGAIIIQNGENALVYHGGWTSTDGENWISQDQNGLRSNGDFFGEVTNMLADAVGVNGDSTIELASGKTCPVKLIASCAVAIFVIVVLIIIVAAACYVFCWIFGWLDAWVPEKRLWLDSGVEIVTC